MNAKKCDRCGKFFDLYTVTNKQGSKFDNGVNYLIQANECSEYSSCHKKVYELCLDCCESFNDWIKDTSLSHSTPRNCKDCKHWAHSGYSDLCRECQDGNNKKYFEPKEVDT